MSITQKLVAIIRKCSTQQLRTLLKIVKRGPRAVPVPRKRPTKAKGKVLR